MIVIDLIFNLSLLVAISVFSGFIDTRFRRTTMTGAILQGILFGSVALLGMLNPFVLAPGLIFDGRSVILSLCALFFGPVAGVIAAVMATCYRLYLGGPGLYMGLSVILVSTLIGTYFHYRAKKGKFRFRMVNLYLVGVFVHVIMVVLILEVPQPLRTATFRVLTFTILGIYPVATALIGKILSDQAESSDRRQTESALKESEERFKSLFNNILMGFSETDPEGRLISANLKFATMLGYGSPEALQAEAASVTDLYVYPEKRHDILAALETSNSIEPTEIELKRRDGSQASFLVSIRALRSRDGTLIKYQSAHIDITGRKQAETEMRIAREQSEKSDLLKTAFMNNISHELRTPLNGILGFGHLLGDSNLTPEERYDYYSILKQNSNRLLNTVTAYMDISLLVSGNQKVTHKSFLPSVMLEELAMKFNGICSDSGLSLVIDMPPGPEKISLVSDRELVFKALGHLIDNAVKFTSRGEVAVGFKTVNDKVEFFVRDSGIGINPEMLTVIFDEFVQENPADTRGHEGSGLGLSISKRIAELLGGTLSVFSLVGQGSVFSLALPVGSPADPSPEPAIPIAGTPGTPLVLVAEDDPTGNLLLQRILGLAGTEVLSVVNGREAVDACRSNPGISLVLMDLKMPVMDGFVASRLIKSMRSDLPVIAVTAYAMTGDEKKALEAGCDDYISKPVDREILLKKLQKFGLLS